MDRKNINRGLKKLRVWQDAISLFILSCKIFATFPFEFKKVAANSIDAAHSISRNISDKHFPMIRYAVLFSNRWKKQVLSQAPIALEQPDPGVMLMKYPSLMG